MLRRRWLVALVFLVACGAKEAVKQTIGETRAQTRLIVSIRLTQTAMPSDADIQLRHSIEDAIEHQHLGTVANATSDVGHMDLAVDVQDSVTAIPKIHEVLKLPLSYVTVALLAIGHGRGADKFAGGRFSPSRTIFAEEYGRPLVDK